MSVEEYMSEKILHKSSKDSPFSKVSLLIKSKASLLQTCYSVMLGAWSKGGANL